MTTQKSCPHGEEYHIKISGTMVRDMISNGINPPKEFIRPEISMLLNKDSFVE